MISGLLRQESDLLPEFLVQENTGQSYNLIREESSGGHLCKDFFSTPRGAY